MADEPTKTPAEVTDPQQLVNEALGTESKPEIKQPTEENKMPEELMETPVPTPVPPPITAPKTTEDIPLAFATKPTNPPTPPTPTPPAGGSTPPPPSIATTPTMPAGIKPAKPVKIKGKKGKMIGVVVGIVLLLTAVVGGLVGYAYMTGKPAIIAYIFEFGSGVQNLDKPGKDQSTEEFKREKETDKKAADAGRPAKVSVEAEKLAEMGRDTSGNLIEDKTCANGYIYNTTTKGCDPETSLLTAYCTGRANDLNAPVCCTEACDPGNVVCEPPGRKECKTTGSNGEKWCLIEANSDSCGGSGGDKTTTKEPETPALMCMTISKDKTIPALGDVVTFTCAGSVTPAGSTVLTYAFRLRKDAGAWQSLTTTGKTASYTVATAGTYDVQCKACGTIEGASVCDPIWTGATQ